MPEAGLIPIPKKLAIQGVKDMVRISDGRMSGTASGTIVLHVSPEAAHNGPLALVRDGDLIELDVENRVLALKVSDDELDKRRQETSCETSTENLLGYRKMFLEQILQAEEGCDFRFSRPPQTSKVPR
jgi:dihydroxy-acid dehydratase